MLIKHMLCNGKYTETPSVSGSLPSSSRTSPRSTPHKSHSKQRNFFEKRLMLNIPLIKDTLNAIEALMPSSSLKSSCMNSISKHLTDIVLQQGYRFKSSPSVHTPIFSASISCNSRLLEHSLYLPDARKCHAHAWNDLATCTRSANATPRERGT